MKPVYLIIVSVLLLILGAFYWFQVRPASIRAKCADTSESIDRIIEINRNEMPQEQIRRLEELKIQGVVGEERNLLYRRCLSSFGLKTEDLY